MASSALGLQLHMLLFPNTLCISLYEHNCVCTVTKICPNFLPANNFCQLLRVTRKRSCTSAGNAQAQLHFRINRERLELATSSIGRIRVFADHTRENKHKQNVSTIFARRAAFHAQTAVHALVTNYGYFDRGKNPNTPNLSPMPVKKKWFGISLVYLWSIRKFAVESIEAVSVTSEYPQDGG